MFKLKKKKTWALASQTCLIGLRFVEGRSESSGSWSYLTGLRAVEGVRVEEAGLTSLVSEPWKE